MNWGVSIKLTVFVLIVFYGVLLSLIYNPLWVLVMASTAIGFGSLSSILAARRFFFLGGAAPHSALMAVALSIPLAYLFGGSFVFWSILIGILLIYVAGYSIYKGVDPDIATAVFVSFTASGGVLAAYYALVNYPIGFDLASLIIGDPILATASDVLLALTTSLITFTAVILTYREQLSLGIDRDSARLSGLRVFLYDFLIFTILGLTMIVYLRIAGYILEHVLVLLPASIAVSRARSSFEALEVSLVTALSSSLLGLHTGILFNLSPSGLTGLYLLLFYLVAVQPWVGRHG